MMNFDIPPQLATEDVAGDEQIQPGLFSNLAYLCGQWFSLAIQQQPTQVGLSLLIGGVAIALPVQGQWKPPYAVASGLISVATFGAGGAIARQWAEETNIASTIITAEKLDMADELATRNEAKALQRRQQYGLPNPVAELQAMQLQMEAAIAQAEQQGGIAPATITVTQGNAEIFPVEDLAQTLADNPSDESNFLFVGKSMSGKSSIIVNAMAKKSADIDWFIFNGKPEKDNQWGGLVGSEYDYWAVNSEEKAIAMLTQFRALVRALQGWQDSGADHYPMFVVADEINNQRLLLKDKEQKTLDKTVSLYSTQCMSEKSGLWISTHTHNVDAIGLDKKLQTSFQIIALGREGKYGTLEACVDDRFVIRSKRKRDELREKLDAYIAEGGTGVLAFTDQGGNARIVRLPHYSKTVQIARSPLNQSASETLEDGWEESDSNEDIRAKPNKMLTLELKQHMEEKKAKEEDPAPETESPRATRTLDLSKLPENGEEFIRYLLKRKEKDGGRFNSRVLYQNWGRKYCPSMDEFRIFLARMGMAGAISTVTDSHYSVIQIDLDSIDP